MNYMDPRDNIEPRSSHSLIINNFAKYNIQPIHSHQIEQDQDHLYKFTSKINKAQSNKCNLPITLISCIIPGYNFVYTFSQYKTIIINVSRTARFRVTNHRCPPFCHIHKYSTSARSLIPRVIGDSSTNHSVILPNFVQHIPRLMHLSLSTVSP